MGKNHVVDAVIAVDQRALAIINENDTVATEEIRFGDNDRLAAVTVLMVDASRLVILTDQPGLYEWDPSRRPGARLIPEMSVEDPALDRMAEGGRPDRPGRGGMITKLEAARMAALAGASTVITGGAEPDVLLKLAAGEQPGTLLRASPRTLDARKRWLASQRQVRGQLVLDAGAVRSLTGQGRSLLPAGVTAVRGDFRRGDLVSCVDTREKGLVNYDCADARQIAGLDSRKLEKLIGKAFDAEMIHRNNLVLANGGQLP